MTDIDYDPLLHWLSIDSTTGQEASYLEALEAALSARGLTVERQPVVEGRWNLLAHSGAPIEVLMNTHVDTVPPFFGPRWDGPKLRARGACDTKGGLFAMLVAWDGLPTELQQRIGFSFVVGEEVDHIGAEHAAKLSFPALRAIVMCEPTRNLLSRGQKGILKLRLRATGKAGHSAFPEAGHSALHTLIEACARLTAHRWPEDPELGPTTLNIGTMNGGVAANVFAPDAEAEVLFRVVSDLDALRASVREVLGPEVQVEEIASNDAIRLLYWDAFETDVVPFNTDAPYLCHHAPVVLMGPGDIRTAHSPDEHIDRGDLETGVQLFRRVLTGLLDGSLPVAEDARALPREAPGR